MPPLLTREKLSLLNKEFYINNNIMGRDRLFNLLRKNYGEEAPSRRKISAWLKRDDIKEILISRDYLINNKKEMLSKLENNNNLKFYINNNTKTGKKKQDFILINYKMN